MNVQRIVVGILVCALSSHAGWSQGVSSAGRNGALGYFDYSSGVFRPIAQKEDFDSFSEAAANPQAGTIVVNFNITIRSAIPATSPIMCGVDAIVTEISV